MKKPAKPITAAQGERWSVTFTRGEGYDLTIDGNYRGGFERLTGALEAKDAYFTDEAARAASEVVVVPVTAVETDPYEIVYLPGDGLFGLRYRGVLVDRFYCYGDAETARVYHQAVVEGEAASERRCLGCADVLPLGRDAYCAACVEDAGSAVLAA